MGTVTTTTLLLLAGVTAVLCGPCPDMDDFDIMYSSDKFVCMIEWQGRGNSDPALGCNPFCESSGYDDGYMKPQDYYDDAGDGSYYPIGSLYVWPGCTFYGYEHPGYGGSVTTYVGPQELYNLPAGPDHAEDSSCPNGFQSYKCLCIQETIECVPSDSYGSVLVCDNIDGIVSTTCTYQQQVGTTYTTSAEESMSVSSSVETSIKTGLKSIFSTSIGTSSSTGYNWATSDSTTYARTITAAVTAEAPAGYVLHIDQVIGLCEDNITRPNYLKTYHTDTKGVVQKDSIRYFSADGFEGHPMEVKHRETAEQMEASGIRDEDSVNQVYRAVNV